MSKISREYQIALAVPQGLAFVERQMQGITELARELGNWHFTRLPDTIGVSLRWLTRWTGDGALALITTPSDARIAQRCPFPVVNLASHLVDLRVPSVVVDHAKIGELAARHLMERGFVRFGFFGTARLWYSRLRRECFARTVARGGGQCDLLEVRSEAHVDGRQNQQRLLVDWLKRLRPPVGILASTDLRAGMVLDACRQLGLKVPDDVGIVGVDNDPVFSEFYDPPLTSVSRNDHAVGRRAAALLDKLMRGGTPPAGPVFVPPGGIVERMSTDTIAIDDPVVAHAVRFVRQHVGERFGVERLLREVHVSRRSLEYRFQAAVGRSPYDYINWLRIETAKRLLIDPQRPKVAAVSGACGFANGRRFRAAFARSVGMTPAAYQRSTERPA